MTPPDEPPSNPYDPNWPKPEQPASSGSSDSPGQPWGQPYGQPYGQDPSAHQPPPSTGEAPFAPHGQQQPWGQAPYGQPGYPSQAPYGTPTYGGQVASHPSATTAMVLGIGALVGMFVCGVPVLLAPFAWMIGGRAVKEIDANPGRWSGREQAQAGRIMGMIGTGLLVLGTIAAIILFTVAFSVTEGSDLDFDPDTDSYTSDPSF